MSIRGALVKKSADQTGANYLSGSGTQTDGDIVSWDSEVYDTHGFHEGVTNPSRLTVPVSVSGQYGIFTACVSLSAIGQGNNVFLSILKNGGYQYIGFGGSSRRCGDKSGGANACWAQVRTGPVLLTSGDYYQVRLYSGDNSITVESESSFGVLVLDSTTQTQRVLCKKSADQTTANYSTPAVITWNTDIYDTDAIHDTGSNTSKLVIPSALNGKYGIVTANVGANAVTAGSTGALAIQKGGSLTYDGFGGNSVIDGNTILRLQCTTQPILLATSDEFEALFYSSDTSITVIAAQSTFGLRVVG